MDSDHGKRGLSCSIAGISPSLGVFTELRYGIILILSPGDHEVMNPFEAVDPEIIDSMKSCSKLFFILNLTPNITEHSD